jgi:hypothetical protein
MLGKLHLQWMFFLNLIRKLQGARIKDRFLHRLAKKLHLSLGNYDLANALQAYRTMTAEYNRLKRHGAQHHAEFLHDRLDDPDLSPAAKKLVKKQLHQEKTRSAFRRLQSIHPTPAMASVSKVKS